ncbi:MAG: mechanosensitive ion channel [Anaerolineae bacterium]|nr:mechanosensitive ion channel [Anaerolineae bacterium]
MDRFQTGRYGATERGRWAHAPRAFLWLAALICLAAFPAGADAQAQPAPTPTAAADETPLEAPEYVDVEPVARDEQIRERLQDILKATGWFMNPDVQVRDGVVFLGGQTETEEFKTWAGDLARRTQDVAAVVNRIEIIEPSPWDFQPALAGLTDLWRGIVRALPTIGFSLVILLITFAAAWLATKITRVLLRRHFAAPLLVSVGARTAGVIVFLIGLYVIFYVTGLTNIALTVIGGTGLLGLVLGIAFQDITENFLASLFLSLQSPFRSGDLVEIEGIIGFVQALTTRTTILMTQDGNHVQIPNATVYKSKLWNYTSNPNRRLDFIVGIGYDESTTNAQEIALGVLAEHPGVLKEPEPLVLVDNLGAAAVNLRIYFWFDGTQLSPIKIKSSVIRLIKRAFQEAGIAMPGEVRELTFPHGLQVRLLEPDGDRREPAAPSLPWDKRSAQEPEAVSTQAEGGLRSEAVEIEEQARHSRSPEEGQDLLKPAEPSPESA